MWYGPGKTSSAGLTPPSYPHTPPAPMFSLYLGNWSLSFSHVFQTGLQREGGDSKIACSPKACEGFTQIPGPALKCLFPSPPPFPIRGRSGAYLLPADTEQKAPSLPHDVQFLFRSWVLGCLYKAGLSRLSCH